MPSEAPVMAMTLPRMLICSKTLSGVCGIGFGFRGAAATSSADMDMLRVVLICNATRVYQALDSVQTESTCSCRRNIDGYQSNAASRFESRLIIQACLSKPANRLNWHCSQSRWRSSSNITGQELLADLSSPLMDTRRRHDESCALGDKAAR